MYHRYIASEFNDESDLKANSSEKNQIAKTISAA